jgi:choice-of-anchor A domain-containing protein
MVPVRVSSFDQCFYEATTLTIQNFAWIGSILAPYGVVQNTQGGNINGQVIVSSWESGPSCTQQNWVPFVGCIPGQ